MSKDTGAGLKGGQSWDDGNNKVMIILDYNL